MNAIPSCDPLPILTSLHPAQRGRWPGRQDAAAETADPVLLFSLPDELQQEILFPCTARDITHLACVSVSTYDALRRHPVMLALTRLEPTCRYAALVDGMEAIQATPLRFRSALMREYASRMVPLEDGNGAIPWLYYLRLCESQLKSHVAASESGALLRNLCIVQPGAMMCMLRGPMRSVTRVYSWENQISLLPKHYRSHLYDALLRLNAVAGGCDGQVWRLIDAGGRDEKCVPLHFIGVMAALQLFDDIAQDVRRRFIARFPLCSQDHGRAFDAIVVGALACCFPQRCDELQKILLRWDEDYSALLPALHASLLQKAAKILSRRWGTLQDPDLTDRPLPRHVAPSDHVLAIPATGEADLAIVQSSMATF